MTEGQPGGGSILGRVLIKVGVGGLRDLPHRCLLFSGLRPVLAWEQTFMRPPLDFHC